MYSHFIFQVMYHSLPTVVMLATKSLFSFETKKVLIVLLVQCINIIFFGIFPSISANTTLYLKQLGRGNVHGFILLHCNGCFMSRTTAQGAFLQGTVQKRRKKIVTFLNHKLCHKHEWDKLFVMFYCLFTFISFTSNAIQWLFL